MKRPRNIKLMDVLFVVFIVAASSSAKADALEQGPAPRAISTLIDAFPTVTVSRNPADERILAVYCEREPQWWGRIAVYHRSGDTIDWTYAFPKSYEERRGHYVVSFRWIGLKQVPNPVLEVIESTHKGNGSLRLFETNGRELRLLLETEVRGRFWSAPASFGVPEDGEAYFEGSHLSIRYVGGPDQTADSISLTGSVRIEDMRGKALPSRKYAQSCLWDPDKRKFIPQTPTTP